MIAPRIRLTLMAVATLALVGALIAVLATGPSRGNEAQGFEGALSPPGVPAANFTLHDQDGKVVRATDLRGTPVILTFMYSTCLNTCPVTAQQIKGALDLLGHDVPALAVAVDPPRDTPVNAKRFLLKQGLTGRMKFLLGSRSELQRVWRAYGIQPQGSGFEHSARVVLLDRKGVPEVAWPSDHLSPEGLAHDLRLLLSRPRSQS
jgi:protein SCO1/2